MNRRSTIAVAALIAVGLAPLTGEAGALTEQGAGTQSAPSIQSTITETSGQLSAFKIKTRPCSDFLKRQGTLNDPDPPLFFPPVKDYVGWTSEGFTLGPRAVGTLGLVDAGLANQYLGNKLGTKVTCLVTQATVPDGSAKITVALAAINALGFALDARELPFDPPWTGTPTIFGAKAQDVVARTKPPALGPATLNVSFRIAAPTPPQKKEAPLPDLVDVLVNTPCQYAPVRFFFASFTYGLSYEKSPQGTKALLKITQDGSTNAPCTALVFGREVVEIIP